MWTRTVAVVLLLNQNIKMRGTLSTRREDGLNGGSEGISFGHRILADKCCPITKEVMRWQCIVIIQPYMNPYSGCHQITQLISSRLIFFVRTVER